MRPAGMRFRRRQWSRMVGAIAAPLLLGAACYGLFLDTVRCDGCRAVEAWRGMAGELCGVVTRGREVASVDAVDLAQDVAWIRQRVPTTPRPATFLEELSELTREIGIDRWEYRCGTATEVAETGYRLDPIDVRVVAPYRRLLALWARLEAEDRPLVCRTIRLQRYGDAVSGTFSIELYSHISAVAGAVRRQGGAG